VSYSKNVKVRDHFRLPDGIKVIAKDDENWINVAQKRETVVGSFEQGNHLSRSTKVGNILSR
jgi:hypothetical protein